MHRTVRALSRGLTLIAELSASGPSNALQLARRTGLNRTTCYRLLDTLRQDGFVTFDETNGLFGLTSRARTLSEGVSSRDLASQAAVPAMFGLLNAVSWPSDFGVFELGSVVIRESTHPFSPLSVHRSMVGRRRSLVRSALGRAILTASSPGLRREMLELTASLVEEDAPLAKDRRFIEGIISQTKDDGYASSVGGSEAGISAIALPIQGGGPVLGSLNLIFFTSSMTPEVAARRYLSSMKQAGSQGYRTSMVGCEQGSGKGRVTNSCSTRIVGPVDDTLSLRISIETRALHRSLLNSATSVSRSLASSGASVSLVIASALGAAFSAICAPARVRLTSRRRPSSGSALVSVRPRAVSRSITPLMVATSIAVNRPSWFCEHGPVSVSLASAAHCVGVRLIPISRAKIAAWRCHT
jgi:IclR family transcriptional regulator, mhp operon transcriptional activator